MPIKALILIMFLTSLAGCAQWPSPAHRDVTLESIQQLLDQQKQAEDKLNIGELAYACTAYTQSQLDMQEIRLDELVKQVQLMNNANPTFANSFCPPVQTASQYEGKMIVGSVEWVYISQPKFYYKARVDSGASTSSIHAKNITRFERNGKKWVRFELPNDDKTASQTIEAPLVRSVAIRQASQTEAEQRPVVRLTVILGSMQHESEFTLTDREKMDYPVLIGRTFLRDIALIDVGRSMIQPKFEPIERTPAKQPSSTTIKP